MWSRNKLFMHSIMKFSYFWELLFFGFFFILSAFDYRASELLWCKTSIHLQIKKPCTHWKIGHLTQHNQFRIISELQSVDKVINTVSVTILPVLVRILNIYIRRRLTELNVLAEFSVFTCFLQMPVSQYKAAHFEWWSGRLLQGNRNMVKRYAESLPFDVQHLGVMLQMSLLKS